MQKVEGSNPFSRFKKPAPDWKTDEDGNRLPTVAAIRLVITD